jgi:hypothetical protein
MSTSRSRIRTARRILSNLMLAPTRTDGISSASNGLKVRRASAPASPRYPCLPIQIDYARRQIQRQGGEEPTVRTALTVATCYRLSPVQN